MSSLNTYPFDEKSSESKKDSAPIIKEKNEGKTIQEKDREKLDEKFSKDKKETLN